jgi:hypothetical protein
VALIIAWGATLLLSRLPEIVLREVAGWDVPWINIVWIVVAAGLTVAASVVPLMHPSAPTSLSSSRFWS